MQEFMTKREIKLNYNLVYDGISWGILYVDCFFFPLFYHYHICFYLNFHNGKNSNGKMLNYV